MFPIVRHSLRIAAGALLVAGIAACDSGTKADAAAPKAASGKDWTKTIAMTPQGGMLVGNPNAKVKLVEFASFTCPHCAEFKAQGVPVLLRNYVSTGNVSYEFRSFLLNGIDIGPSLLAMCQPPESAWKFTSALFATQQQWVQGYQNIPEAEGQRLTQLPPDQAIVAIADAGGLDDFARMRGVPKAKFTQCLSNSAGFDKLQANAKEAVEKYGLTGTPTFVINGETVKNAYSWAALEPALKDALN
jgi:protein-disulfide isomerase